MTTSPAHIEMIAISDITVANPRDRSAKVHRAITDSIDQVGPKRPVTVRRVVLKKGGPPYELVCGQGRLESCKMLGQTEIAALVIDVDEETGHVMSIIENVARRKPRSIETLEHVRTLKARGYTDAEVASKLGCTAGWVANVALLLERGEKRLLAAIEAGHMPMHLAVHISRARGPEIQQLLHSAYERGEVTGNKVAAVRKILERRERVGKGFDDSFRKGPTRSSMTPEDLRKLYERDVEMHRRIQKKAEHAQKSLLLAQQIFKELFANKEFCGLLQTERLLTVPQPLAELAYRGGLHQ